MDRWRNVFAVVVCLGVSVGASAQRQHRDTLTPGQIEQIREAGIDPNLRIALYTKFLDERAEALKKLSGRAISRARNQKLDNQLQDFTSLMDELGSNLDQYGDRKADMRPALKKLNGSTPQWLSLLKALPEDTAFDESRKEAIESCQDLSDDAKQLETQQLAYFTTHKKQKGQERAEPE